MKGVLSIVVVQLGTEQLTPDSEEFNEEVLKFGVILCTPECGSLSSLSVEPW